MDFFFNVLDGVNASILSKNILLNAKIFFNLDLNFTRIANLRGAVKKFTLPLQEKHSWYLLQQSPSNLE